ncbi:insulin-degrading enzyme-like isoform X1 [Mizuhopecten yessoensis]|uniref:insulin-degrading enzyme-like isoform X1 n=1 Tax=Mizuhopecten yessoensis TaxID=6573 RepID=UPI000B458DED|nr:insulin-degrading enzyme-like isoform X1 [Mizuhopecten yessoensis]
MMGTKFIKRSIFNDKIIKSMQDKRQYRGLELMNGLKVMVISDPDTDKSSAAMDVHIGAMSDPWETQGLAHFCEHMLFLGSKKFEQENSYKKFLNEHGGLCNASTGPEHTTYYFDVAPDHLHGALDRLSQFFISPLFTASATEREVNAVNSENDKNIPIDGRRLLLLDRKLSKPGHDWGKFSCGNKDTLGTIPVAKGIDIREALLSFHAKHYSANIMSLCVLGKESLDELSEMVLPMFAEVENKNVTVPEWTDHPYGPDQLKTVCYAVPVKEIRSLSLMWATPDLQDFYTAKPGNYLAHLIGHEAKGSLLSELKAKGWANSLSCGSSLGAKGFRVLTVTIQFTEDGLEHIDDMVMLTYQYIAMLKSQDPLEWIFTEYQNIRAMKFRFKDKEESRNYTPSVCRAMQIYPMEEALSGGHLMSEFRPDLITQILEKLVPHNMRMRVVAKKYEDIVDQTEPLYGTKYRLEKIPKEKLQTWSCCGFHENLKLPAVNEFIPESFEIVPREANPCDLPQLVKDSDLCRVWFHQDNTFLQPKASIKFELNNPLTYLTPTNHVLTKLFVMLFKDALNEYSYNAGLAGLHYDLSATKYGITLSISGYSDKQPVLLKKILDKLTQFSVDPDQFYIIKEKFERILKNFRADQPSSQVSAYTSELMSEVQWTHEEKLQALQGATIKMVEDFVPKMLKTLYIEGLVTGNVTTQGVLTMTEMVEKVLQSQSGTRPLQASQRRRLREHQLPQGSSFMYECTNDVHKSTCTQVYLQCGPEDTASNVLLELLSQSLKESCFTTLRTKEQLGYIVRSGPLRSSGVQGYRILVQSHRSPQYVEGRIEAFLSAMDEQLKMMTEEEFQKHVAAMTVKRLDKPKNIREQNQYFWFEVRDHTYNFDRDNIEVAFLKTLERKDLYQFFKEHVAFDACKRQKLAIHVVSTLESSDSQEEITPDSKIGTDITSAPDLPQPVRVTDVSAFKGNLPLYPLQEPYIDLCKAKSLL